MQENDFLSKYQRHLSCFMHSPATDNLLLMKARQYLRWRKVQTEIFPPINIHEEYRVFLRYMSWIQNRNISDRTISNTLSCLRSFFRFMSFDYPAFEFHTFIRLPKCESKIPSVMSIADVEKILSCIDRSTIIGSRDYCLFELIYSSGLRNSEAGNLLIDNVNLRYRYLIVCGKGRKERLVPFGDRAAAAVERYLYIRRLQEEFWKSKLLFLSMRGGKLTNREVLYRFHIYEEKAGLNGYTVHTLRHSCATHMLQGGADILSISKFLGHSDLSTTQIYTHVDDSYLRAHHERYFPRKLKSGTKNPD